MKHHYGQVAASQSSIIDECVISHVDSVSTVMRPQRVPPLRAREFQILAFLVQYTTRNGFLPQTKELQAACGNRNKTLVLRSLMKLAAHGLIQMRGQSIRTIRLAPNASAEVVRFQTSEGHQ